MIKNKKIYIGTSGYMISQKKWLELDICNSLEINSTFYRQPKPKTWQTWYAMAPKGFLYAVKMSQFMTHKKRLKDSPQSWDYFWNDGAELLKDKLGVILFQFPPSFKHTSKKYSDNKTNFERLKDLKKILPKKVLFAFEFRDTSWFVPEIYTFFTNQNWCLVNVFINNETGWYGNVPTGFQPDQFTADFIYIRLHGKTGEFQGAYTKNDLRKLLMLIKQKKKKKNFIYFNNTFFKIRTQSCTIAGQKIDYAAVCNAIQLCIEIKS